MKETPLQGMEDRLLKVARQFPYPPTPNLSQRVMEHLTPIPAGHKPYRMRRLALTTAFLLVMLGALMSVPPVRAQILKFIPIGLVRIFLNQPEIPEKTPNLLPSLMDLAGKTSLEDARLKTHFPILLPSFPPGAGLPNAVFLQNLGGQALILVWLDPKKSDSIWFSIHELESGSYTLEKIQPKILEQTTVLGNPAVWTTGPYILKLRNGQMDERRMIDGHVLIWAEGNMTYRLETTLSLEEAVRIAESLQPEPYPRSGSYGTASP